MKKGLVFVFASMMLLCGCNRLFESEKERLDRMMGIHWENWKSAGKDTGVGCHFLLQPMKVKSESEVAQSCLTFSRVPPLAAYQAPPSMRFSRQEYWSGVSLPSPPPPSTQN